MRHTRNRQIMKLEGLEKVSTKFPNLPITLVRSEHWQLDPTFKWHREFGKDVTPRGYNFIEFQGKTRLVKF